MKRMSSLKNQAIVLFTVLCMALLPYAVEVRAQTPGAADPPPPVEIEPPPAAEPPPPPAETPPAAETPPPPVEEPPVTELAPPAENPEVIPDSGSDDESSTEEATEQQIPESTEPLLVEETEEPTTEDTEEPTVESTDETITESEEPTTEAIETPATEPVAETPDGINGTPTQEAADDSAPATPTPTEEVIVPDQLQIAGDVNITIAPGEYKDIVIRYTLGSDREKTEMSANLTAPGGESLEGWTLVPWQRVDLDEDPLDANREIKARIDYAESLENGDVYETTWRITTPNHIEKPLNVRLHVSTKIHRDDGVTDGVIKNDLVSINATASAHTPTLACDEVIAEDIDNTWNCAFETTHPDNDVQISASADVPEGWELALDGSQLIAEPQVLSAEAITASSFTLAATYQIGCPDVNATFSSSLDLTMTYPSGEVSVLTAELLLVFVRPNPSFEITSFVFDDMDLTQTLSTTGHMTVSYDELPCAWQATLQLTDLESDMYMIPSDLIRIESVDGLSDATVSIVDGSISIAAGESMEKDTNGVFTIHFGIDLPHQIPPGAYRIGVTIQFGWADQI